VCAPPRPGATGPVRNRRGNCGRTGDKSCAYGTFPCFARPSYGHKHTGTRGERITMSVTVRVPTILRSYTAAASEVTASGATVVEILQSLEGQSPGIRDRIADEDGEIRRFVNVYVGDDDIRFADGVRTAVTEGAVMSVIPAVAGGAET